MVTMVSPTEGLMDLISKDEAIQAAPPFPRSART